MTIGGGGRAAYKRLLFCLFFFFSGRAQHWRDHLHFGNNDIMVRMEEVVQLMRLMLDGCGLMYVDGGGLTRGRPERERESGR